jgi:predicted nucleic acid-binding protein
MDRLFLDANVLFSAAYRADAGLLRLWKLRNARLCSSRYALEEARINLADEGQRMRLARLSRTIQFFEAAQQELSRGISLPEKDVPILLAAMEARATHLLTGDIRHFGAYLGKKVAGIVVVLPGEYLRRRVRREPSGL